MRKEDWHVTLADYLRRSESLTFEWGVNDCALWASTFVDLITGSDHADAWRGEYSTETGARRLMLQRGFFGVEGIADSILPTQAVEFAQRGDLVLDPNGCLGVCNGRMSHFLTFEGVVIIPTLACPKAWKV